MIKLIIVDDSEGERNMLAKSIDWEQNGITFAGFANDGEAALKLIKDKKPDIVLTDISMPIKSGIELACEINLNYQEIKTIFITAYEQFEFAKAGLEYNVVDYIKHNNFGHRQVPRTRN